MSSKYPRPLSPRGRYATQARSSTGTFVDTYPDPSYYVQPPSPRVSVDRLGTSSQGTNYTLSASSAARVGSSKYEQYKGRPRRNTNDMTIRPHPNPQISPSVRPSYLPQSQYDRPGSPLFKAWDKRGDTYVTQAPSRGHKKVYSVDDASRKTQLVADITPAESLRHRDGVDRGYTASGGRVYQSGSKPPPRLTDYSDDGYSYTDPASMYRDTEPAWRRQRSGSCDRALRPTSLTMDQGPRNSARELGPPPSNRGFEKISNGLRPHGQSPPTERLRDSSRYDKYSDAPTRSLTATTSRSHAPAIHQAPYEPHRRDAYHDEYYGRRERDVDNRRHSTVTVDRFEDRDVASRGFGVAQGDPHRVHEHHVVDGQPLYGASDTDRDRTRPEERRDLHYPPERSSILRMPSPRVSRDRDLAPAQDNYEKQPRERGGSRQESRGYAGAAAVGIAAASLGSAAASLGSAAGLGGAAYAKHEHDKDRDDRRYSGEKDRDRERRERYDDRRDRGPDERHEGRREARVLDRRDAPSSPARNLPPSTHTMPHDDTRDTRDRRHEDAQRDQSGRKTPSSEGSEDERHRHYVDRDTDRRNDSTFEETELDPDEEYRRRIQQEAERSRRANRDRDSDPDHDREQDRQGRKGERDRARRSQDDSTGTVLSGKQEGRSRYDERSGSLYDNSITQEPESMEDALVSASKSVQIVEPSKESPPPVKGILRKPTEKFPDHKDSIREGVAPHKDSMKGKDIPAGARWTRIDRRLVNPEALEQAKERFEERMDCVIVLRVLTKQEIQKLADRTKRLREARGV